MWFIALLGMSDMWGMRHTQKDLICCSPIWWLAKVFDLTAAVWYITNVSLEWSHAALNVEIDTLAIGWRALINENKCLGNNRLSSMRFLRVLRTSAKLCKGFVEKLWHFCKDSQCYAIVGKEAQWRKCEWFFKTHLRAPASIAQLVRAQHC